MRIGTYEIFEELGRGATGVVYRARRADLDREFALKVLDPGVAGSPEARDRFRREARAAAGLAGHPHIVAVHDVGEGFVASDAANPLADARRAAPSAPDERDPHAACPVLYLAMELIRGETLAARLASGDVAPDAALAVGLAVARALAHAHAAGVVHRDVKPANILLAADGRILLADFGLARPVDPAATAHLTRSGEILGTPAYMAPEQARGETADGRADLYALGATLYEACAGRPPFDAETISALLAQVLRDPPLPLARRAPAVSSALAAIVDRCLEKAPADRYPSADALAEDLARAGRGESPRVAPLPLAARVGRRLRSHRLAAALGLATVAGGALVSWLATRGSGADPTTAMRDAERGTREATQAARASAVFEALVRRTQAPLRRLEDRFHDAPGAADGAAAALAEVEAAVDGVAAEFPGAALPRSWRALARFLARTPDALAELEAARGAPEDPFPLLLYAHAALLAYARDVQPPLPALIKDRSVLREFLEAPAVASSRRAATAALRFAREHPLWSQCTHGATYRQFADAATRFGDRDFAGAARELEGLQLDPLLGGAATLLRALAEYTQGRFDAAANTWATLRARRWPQAQTCEGIAHLAAGNEQLGVDEEPLPAYDRALAALDAVLAWVPTDMVARRWRATARRSRGEALHWRRQPPWEDFAAALADFDIVLAAEPDSPETRCFRAGTWWTLADAEEAAGRDPRASYRAAVADYDVAVARNPDYPEAWLGRGIAWRGLAKAEARRGGEPWAAFAQAVDDHRAAHARGVGVVAVNAEIGDWLERARAEQAAQRDPGPSFDAGAAAIERAMAEESRAADVADVAQTGASLHHFRAQWRVLAGEDARADAERAIGLATRGLELKPGFLPFYLLRGQASALLGEAQRRAGENPGPAFRAALADVEHAIARDPTDASLVYTRGAIHLTMGDAAVNQGLDPRDAYERAAAGFDEARRIAPHLWQAHVQLVQLLRRLGREADAQAALVRGLAEAPGSPELRDLAARLGQR